MKLLVRLSLLFLLVLCACAVPRRAGPPAAVATVRQAERRLGVEPAANFGYASSRPAYDLCFFTGKLELPAAGRKAVDFRAHVRRRIAGTGAARE